MGGLVGFEHEYRVFGPAGRIDFRSCVHELSIPGRRLDPGDPHAYRLHSGLKLTCDDREAEIASPPEVASAGVTRRLADWAAHGTAVLRRLCPDLTFVGESTHLSVSVPDDISVEVGGLFVRAFGPALMLCMDDLESPGLLVRPRTGRLELAAEYVHGDDLRVAAALAVGGVAACVDVVVGARPRSDLGRDLRMRVEPAVDRWGWYLDRSAFGSDLVAGGRSARLDRVRRGRVRGQDVLEHAWKLAREHAAATLGPEDLDAADDAVFGLRALPAERDVDRRPPADLARPLRSAEGDVVATRERPDAVVQPFACTWDHTVLEVAAGSRRRYLAVPRARLAATVRDLDAGRLDAAIRAALDRTDLPVLAGHRAAVRGGWFGSVHAVQLLASPERDVFGVPQPHPADPALAWPRAEVAAPRVLTAPRAQVSPADDAPVELEVGEETADDIETITADELTERFGKQIGAPPPPLIEEDAAPSVWTRPLTWVGVGISAIAVGLGVVVLTGDDSPPDAVPVVDDDRGEDPAGGDGGSSDSDAPGDGDATDPGDGDPPAPDPGDGDPGVADPNGAPVPGGISPDLLGLFELGSDGLINFAYEGDQIIGRVVEPSRNSLTLNLWGFTGQCWGLGAEPSQFVNDAGQIETEWGTVAGDRVFILDAFGSGRWITFDRVPAPDISGSVFRCIPGLGTADTVQVTFNETRADANGFDGDTEFIHSMIRTSDPDLVLPSVLVDAEPDGVDVVPESGVAGDQRPVCLATDQDPATPDVELDPFADIRSVDFRFDPASTVEGFAPGGLMRIDIGEAGVLPIGWSLEFSINVQWGEFVLRDGVVLGQPEWNWGFDLVTQDFRPATTPAFGAGAEIAAPDATAAWVGDGISIRFPTVSTIGDSNAFSVAVQTTARAEDDTGTTCNDFAFVGEG